MIKLTKAERKLLKKLVQAFREGREPIVTTPVHCLVYDLYDNHCHIRTTDNALIGLCDLGFVSPRGSQLVNVTQAGREAERRLK